MAVEADASVSSGADLPIASYSFDFGDGTALVGPQTQPTADHTYAFAGTYALSLTVTDTAGRSSTATRQVTATTTDIVTNSSFESGTAGWNASPSSPGVTLTRVAGGHSGTSAARLTNTGTSAGYCVLNDHPDWVAQTAPGLYTASLWVRSDTPGATLGLRDADEAEHLERPPARLGGRAALVEPVEARDLPADG